MPGMVSEPVQVASWVRPSSTSAGTRSTIATFSHSRSVPPSGNCSSRARTVRDRSSRAARAAASPTGASALSRAPGSSLNRSPERSRAVTPERVTWTCAASRRFTVSRRSGSGCTQAVSAIAESSQPGSECGCHRATASRTNGDAVGVSCSATSTNHRRDASSYSGR